MGGGDRSGVGGNNGGGVGGLATHLQQQRQFGTVTMHFGSAALVHFTLFARGQLGHFADCESRDPELKLTALGGPK